jgi:hypothetical protein
MSYLARTRSIHMDNKKYYYYLSGASYSRLGREHPRAHGVNSLVARRVAPYPPWVACYPKAWGQSATAAAGCQLLVAWGQSASE